jgi:histidine triad (HIT) family protein
MDCIFCKIINGEIPVSKVYENDKVIAFKDIKPEAPIHLLVVPKKHIVSAAELSIEDQKDLLPEIFTCINHLADEFGIAETGFRIVNNCGEQGGQTVYHIHFHLLGGRQMRWPPG